MNTYYSFFTYYSSIAVISKCVSDVDFFLRKIINYSNLYFYYLPM